MTCIELTHNHFEVLRVIRDNGSIETDLEAINHVHAAGLATKNGQQSFLTPDGESALADYEEIGGFDTTHNHRDTEKSE